MKDPSSSPMADFWSSLAKGGASGLVSGGVSSLFSELFADSQQKRMRDNMRFQQQLNLDSLRKSPLATVQGLKNAGLNPALLNGQSYSGQVAMAQQSQPTGSLTPISLSDLFQGQAAQAQARYTNALADKQEIENNRETHKDFIVNQFKDSVSQFFKDWVDTFDDDVKDTYELGKYIVKDHEQFGKMEIDLGELAKRYQKKQYKFLKKDFNLGDVSGLTSVYNSLKNMNDDDFDSHINELKTKLEETKFKRSIIMAQNLDPEVKNALIKIPTATYLKFLKEIDSEIKKKDLYDQQGKLTKLQVDYQEWYNKMEQDTSISSAIADLKNAKSPGEVLSAFFTLLLRGAVKGMLPGLRFGK